MLWIFLDIVIPKDEMEKADLVEQLVEWGGERFSREPARYIGKKALVFEQVPTLEYHWLLGHDLDAQKYSALIYQGEEVEELEYLANSPEGDLKSRLLFVFLENLITLSSYYIFLRREDEVIKEQYEIETAEELRSVLCESLSWTMPKDILIVKE